MVGGNSPSALRLKLGGCCVCIVNNAWEFYFLLVHHAMHAMPVYSSEAHGPLLKLARLREVHILSS